MDINKIIDNAEAIKGQHFVYVLDLGWATKFGISSSLGRRMKTYKNRERKVTIYQLFQLKTQDSTYALERKLRKKFKDRRARGIEYTTASVEEVTTAAIELAEKIKDKPIRPMRYGNAGIRKVVPYKYLDDILASLAD